MRVRPQPESCRASAEELARPAAQAGRRALRGDAGSSASSAHRCQARPLCDGLFASLYPPRRLRRYARALAAVQDVLGRLNDAAVAAGLLRQLAQADPALAESAGFVNGFLSADARRAASKLDRRWRQIERIGPPRRK
ncbi:MAG: CHAD domain-containing protein [Betaproteobacteria bacterium]|nr:CHAD domain-containing protein [Betaproteobacteria bacterium]